MPIAKNKHYFQYEKSSKIMWSKIQDILRDTTELVVIGCAVNEEDEELWKKLKSMDENVSIKIVSVDKQGAEQVAQKFKQHPFINVSACNANGFLEYVEQYLSEKGV